MAGQNKKWRRLAPGAKGKAFMLPISKTPVSGAFHQHISSFPNLRNCTADSGTIATRLTNKMKKTFFSLCILAAALAIAACRGHGPGDPPLSDNPDVLGRSYTAAPVLTLTGGEKSLSYTITDSNPPAARYDLYWTVGNQTNDTTIKADAKIEDAQNSGTIPNLDNYTPYSAVVVAITENYIDKDSAIVRKTPGMVSIPAGTFMMGSPDGTKGTTAEPGRDVNENNQHSVTLDKAFMMAKYQITQEQFFAVMGKNPSSNTNQGGIKLDTAPGETVARNPVERVTWYEAIAFCNKLSLLAGLDPVYSVSGVTDWENLPNNKILNNTTNWNNVTQDLSKSGYRLPTEAEWEYACRAGTTGMFNFPGQNYIRHDLANFNWENPLPAGTTTKTWPNKSMPVGGFTPNDWGLYDMHGNVWEWCWDRYGVYSAGSQTNPTGPAAITITDRVHRGGSWWHWGSDARSARRRNMAPATQDQAFGFRVVCKAQ
jgi:formylglycine-generating enzyme required for sulfatase activity